MARVRSRPLGSKTTHCGYYFSMVCLLASIIDWLINEIDNHIGDVGANALADVYEKPLTSAGIPAYIAMNSCVAECFVIMPNYFVCR